MKTVTLRIKEYDRWDGCIQCTQNNVWVVDWLGGMERTIRNFLAGGDYSCGDEDRTVEVYVVSADGERHHATYSAPRIRKFNRRSPVEN